MRLNACPNSLPQVVRQDVGVVLATVLPRVDLRAVALFQFVLKLLPSLLYSQTQPVLNAFAKEVQFGQEKCAEKCANCTRIWGKLELLSHCSTSHNHGGLEPLKATQRRTKNPRRSEGLLWYYRDSNLGHTDFQSVALPTEL